MNDLSNSFLLFKSDSLFFLLPLLVLSQVTDAEKTDEIPAVECRALLGRDGGTDAYRYRLLLHADPEEAFLSLPAQEVLGLLDIEEEQRLELPEQLRSDNNRYLEAAAEVEIQEGRKIPAYILNPVCLQKHQNRMDGKQTVQT